MVFMNCSNGQNKLQSVVHALTGCDRRRSYYLSIATCYCTPQAVREFIDAVRAKVKLLVKIYLYVDRRTAISIGRAELSELERAYPDLLKVYAVRTARLFHTKGFCLAAYDADDEPVHGRLAIGSANLTNPGLTAMHGNVESLAVHSDISTISEFLEFFENEDVDGNLLTIDQLTDFSPYDTTDFQYALLTRGLFSHKWSASLAAYFSVRYRLNDVGRQQAAAGVDVAGFQVEAATISKSYFVDFDPQAWRPNDRNLVLNFGIECFLGHWIPKSVFESNEDNKEPFNQFKSALFEELELAMDAKCREILEDYDELRHVGIIVSVR